MSRSNTAPKSDARTVMIDFRYAAVRSGHRTVGKIRTCEISIVYESGVPSLELYPGINFVDAELLAKHKSQPNWKYANACHVLSALPDPDALADLIERSCGRAPLVQLRGLVERAEFATEYTRSNLLEAIDARLELNLFEAPKVPYVAPAAVTAAMNVGATA